MKRIIILSFCLLFLFLARPAQAIVDPRQSPNNRVGIHILNPEDVKPAADLVNPNGDWGYVTVVLRLNDLNKEKWQATFDDMRRRHLIPIVRLATTPDGNVWVKPQPEDADRLAEFLNSLNWVVQNRYVILFNEPNHAREWGNEIKPQEYVTAVKNLREKLKAASADFFILPAGMDTAAPNSGDTMAATEYWRQMYLADNSIFSQFDGWNSHSYPNPDFSGPLSGAGLGSIRSYLAEVNYLGRFGLPGNLPVFITETGWRDQGKDLSQNYLAAFSQIWTQPNLVAVTPFVLNYPQPPFKQFSWLGTSQYQAVAAMAKTSGLPVQIQSSQMVDQNLPDEVVTVSDYRFFVEFKNLGQSIWDRDSFSLSAVSNLPAGSVLVGHVATTEPGQSVKVDLNLKTPGKEDTINLKLQLAFKGRPFGGVLEKTISVVPPPQIVIRARTLFKIPGANDRYRLLVYDADNYVVQETPVTVSAGYSDLINLYNLVPGQAYRLVLLKPGYLPRQTWIVMSKGKNQAKFQSLLPLDFNNDGRLSIADFFAWLLQPLHYFGLRL